MEHFLFDTEHRTWEQAPSVTPCTFICENKKNQEMFYHWYGALDIGASAKRMG